MCYKAQMGGRGLGRGRKWDVEGREGGQEPLLRASLCQWGNWIAPPDNDKAMCSSSSRQVQSSACLCTAELASEDRKRQHLLFFSVSLVFSRPYLYFTKKQTKKKETTHTFDGAVQPETGRKKPKLKKKRQTKITGNLRGEASSRR